LINSLAAVNRGQQVLGTLRVIHAENAQHLRVISPTDGLRPGTRPGLGLGGPSGSGRSIGIDERSSNLARSDPPRVRQLDARVHTLRTCAMPGDAVSIGTESSVLALGSEVLVTEIAGEAVRDLAHGLNATRNSDLKMITRSHGIAGLGTRSALLPGGRQSSAGGHHRV
jgi:hypothetical protein